MAKATLGAQDTRKAAKNGKNGESAVLAAIARMPEPYRAMSNRIHALIKVHAPILSAKTWYGMPAYAKDGKVVCFFQIPSPQKFNRRYPALGFSDEFGIAEGSMWPLVFAIKELTPSEEAKIIDLLKVALG